jgi:hypothetical protein
MKAKDIIYLLAIGALAALLLRECARKPQTVERIVVQTIDLDSLKRTLPPDTVIVPGPARQVVRYVTVTVTSQAQADSLAKEYAALAQQFSDMQTELQWAWMQGEGQFPFEVEEPEHVYADSITTGQYFHRWDIRAQGPIKSYSYGIIPICPTSPTVKAATPKYHRAGLYVGGQTLPGGGLRPAYGLKYGWAGLNVHGTYLPGTGAEPRAFQLLTGFEIPFK